MYYYDIFRIFYLLLILFYNNININGYNLLCIFSFAKYSYKCFPCITSEAHAEVILITFTSHTRVQGHLNVLAQVVELRHCDQGVAWLEESALITMSHGPPGLRMALEGEVLWQGLTTAFVQTR